MFAAMEAADLRNCDAKPYRSAAGKLFVIEYLEDDFVRALPDTKLPVVLHALMLC